MGSDRGARPATAAVLLALIAFALVGIGGPLLGQGVFAGTDEFVQTSPYRDAGLAGDVQNTYLDDTYDTIIPNTLLFADALRDGEIAAWNPYVLGGAGLGATPNFAVASPLTIPYYLLPGWLAPAYVKLLEIAVAAGGCFLFARRCGLGRPAAVLGGLVFVTGAFLVAWTNWPQTRTAAVVPFVFWAIERLVQRGRWSDMALLAGAVAAMLFGGFPAVTGYALLFAAIYLAVRVLAEHRAGGWGADLRVAVAAGIGVAGGVALAAVQLLPFVSLMSTSLVEGREQTPADHLPHEALLTALAPFALGTVNPARPPAFVLDVNLVEALSYVGAGALVLVAVAVAAARAGRGLLPRGVWLFLVLGTVLTVVVTYGGGLPLAAAQQLPALFAENYVGRIRSLLGFLVAVLAAVGFEVLLRGRERRPTWVALVYAVMVWLALVVLGAVVWRDARWVADAADDGAADGAGRLAALDREVIVALGFVAVAVACAAALWWAGRSRAGAVVRGAAAALLPLVIALQALGLARDYWPRSDRDTFYPVTSAQRFLAAELGHERFAHALGGMGTGADAPMRLRALNGHTFVNERFGELVEALPGTQVGDPPTLPVLAGTPEVVSSPVLDRLGTRYFAVSPAQPVFGVPSVPPVDGSAPVSLEPGVAVEIPVERERPLRAIGVVPVGALPPPAETRVEVALRTPEGAEVARAGRTGHGMVAGEPFTVPVAAESTAGSPLTAELTVRGPQPLQVQATGGMPAVSTVGAEDDGLWLAHAGDSTIYERRTALPRIRWASEAVVEPDAQRRLDLVAGGTLGPEQVVLDAPSSARIGGGSAAVRVIRDGIDEIEAEVDATGGGYLVVADALQNGWTVTVNGAAAELLPADHGVVAVAVPAGEHVVRWQYSSDEATLGAWVSVAAAVVLGGVVAGELGRRGRRAEGDPRYASPNPVGPGAEVIGPGSLRGDLPRP